MKRNVGIVSTVAGGRCRKGLVGVLLALWMVALPAAATDPVTQAADTAIRTNKAAAVSQDRVDQLDDQTKALLERFRKASWQAQQLKVYAQQLEQLTTAQEAERASIERQIAELDNTERELLPLMLRMVDTLEKFVSLDLPFLREERQERVANLRRLLADPEKSIAEKYQRILEAFQIEADYGRSLGAERADVDGRVGDVLRIGRTALFYLSSDGESVLRWDSAGAKWQPLERRHLDAVRKGLKIARETAAADLLVLPMPVAAALTEAAP
jgi:CRP-like cAMP-binding protein